MRITIDGERKETPLHRTIPPNQWNSKKRKAKSSYKFHNDLNHFLDHTRNQIFIHQEELERNNKVVSARTLMDKYLNRGNYKKTLLKIYEEHNKKMSNLIGNGVAFNTHKRHVTSKDHIERFIRMEYKQPDYYLRDLTPEFFDRLETYFRVTRKCSVNTTSKYLKNVGKIIRWAIKNEWITSNPLKNLELKYEPVNKEYLTQAEFKSLQKVILPSEKLEAVRDIFVFCCFTGLAYADVQQLSENNIVVISDNIGLRISRQKTKQNAFIPLLPPAIQILEKYKKHPKCLMNQKALPVLSNQKMNNYLKEIASYSGINKSISTHTARHTFATTVTLANNISMESVSKMLGHSDMTITKQYARILDLTLINEMSNLAKKQY